MKKLTIFITLLLFIITSFSQQSTGTTTRKTATDYLNKSKKQKTAAWIILGGGFGLMIVGALIPQGEPTGEYVPDPFTIVSESHENDGIKGAFVAVGMISMLGSVPFFIASGKNKRKAASLSFINMRTLQIKNSSMVYKPIPAVSLKIKL